MKRNFFEFARESIDNDAEGFPMFDAYDNRKPKSGKWSPEEERYCKQLIDAFETGRLPDCEEGVSLRAYLSRKLNCSPMRISKKFARLGIGKHVYTKFANRRRYSDVSDISMDSICSGNGNYPIPAYTTTTTTTTTTNRSPVFQPVTIVPAPTATMVTTGAPAAPIVAAAVAAPKKAVMVDCMIQTEYTAYPPQLPPHYPSSCSSPVTTTTAEEVDSLSSSSSSTPTDTTTTTAASRYDEVEWEAMVWKEVLNYYCNSHSNTKHQDMDLSLFSAAPLY